MYNLLIFVTSNFEVVSSMFIEAHSYYVLYLTSTDFHLMNYKLRDTDDKCIIDRKNQTKRNNEFFFFSLSIVFAYSFF